MITVRSSQLRNIDLIFNIWLAAARATYHFLSEADVEFYAGIVRHNYLPHAELWGVVDASDRPVAFLGMTGATFDALFAAPDQHGKGVGRLLVYHVREYTL